MNARNQTDLAVIEKGTAIAKEVLGDILAMGDWPIPLAASTFNDDDIYVYSVATRQLIKHHPVNSPEVFCARYHGLKVLEGHSWARGRTAKTLSLWSERS